MGNLICKLFGHRFVLDWDVPGLLYRCKRKHCTATRTYVENYDGTYIIIITECTDQGIQERPKV